LKTNLTLEIECDAKVTDPEALAYALDRLLETALSTPGVLDEYGNPTFGEFLVAESPTDTARRFVLYDFDQRELATVLAALRYFQELVTQRSDSAVRRFPHFADYEPLSAADIDVLCERLNCGGDAACAGASTAAMAQAKELPREALVEIVSGIQVRLYLDMDGTGREFWNPRKAWNCCDVCQDVQDLLYRHGLVPGGEITVLTEGTPP